MMFKGRHAIRVRPQLDRMTGKVIGESDGLVRQNGDGGDGGIPTVGNVDDLPENTPAPLVFRQVGTELADPDELVEEEMSQSEVDDHTDTSDDGNDADYEVSKSEIAAAKRDNVVYERSNKCGRPRKKVKNEGNGKPVRRRPINVLPICPKCPGRLPHIRMEDKKLRKSILVFRNLYKKKCDATWTESNLTPRNRQLGRLRMGSRRRQ